MATYYQGTAGFCRDNPWGELLSELLDFRNTYTYPDSWLCHFNNFVIVITRKCKKSMSTTKFANVKISSLVILECFPNDQKLWEYLVNKTHTVCVWVIHHTLVKSPLESLSWRPGARGRGSPEPSPILLSGGYLLTYADTASQFSLELKLKPKSFCQAQPQLNFNPIEAGIVLFSFNTAILPLSFFTPFWVIYKHISIIIIRNI